MQIPVDRIFFINLDRSHIRKKNLIDHFKKLDIKDKDGREPIRFPALTGSQVTHSIISKKHTDNPGLSLSTSEKGCYASHRALLQMQIENKWPFVMYLEDDVRFDEEKLSKLIENWEQLPDFDFFNLSWKYYKYPKTQRTEPVEFPIDGLTTGDGMWLAHCYILSLHGAIKCEELTRVQSHCIDWHYSWIQSLIPSIGFEFGVIASQDNKGSGMKSTIIHT